MITRLLYDKGVREYVAAARQLRISHPEIKCWLVGQLDSNPSAVRPHELEEWVSEGVMDYLGVLSDIRPTMAAASVYVFPSYYREGTPRSVLEAMAMGRPIITTDSPGCRETVKQGINGFLIPPRDVPALVQAMESLAVSALMRETMGKESRAIAEDKYDVRKVNDDMLRIMDLG
jgi:glycosyltransferase involved in cell wall biosynthesis